MKEEQENNVSAVHLNKRHFDAYSEMNITAFHFGNEAARCVFSDIARFTSESGGELHDKIKSGKCDVLEHPLMIRAINSLEHIESGVLLSVMLIEGLIIVSTVNLEDFREQVTKVGESNALLNDSISVKRFNVKGGLGDLAGQQKVLVDDDIFGDAQ